MDYKNKKVKLLLSGNIVVEGVVKSWNSNSVHLISLDGSSTSIITHPNEDIRVIKVFEDKVDDVEVSQNTKVTVSNLQNKFEEVYRQPVSDSLRLKKLVDLKKDLIQQEKEIISNKLKDHAIEEVRKIKYEQPRFLKK